MDSERLNGPSDRDLGDALSTLSSRDKARRNTAIVLIYRHVLGVAAFLAHQTNSRTVLNRRLDADVANAVMLDLLEGAAKSFDPERSAQGWLYVNVRNKWWALTRKGQLGKAPGEDSPVQPSDVVVDLTDIVSFDTHEDDADKRFFKGISEARGSGFISDAEFGALVFAWPTQRLGEAVAEWVFDDATKTATGEKRLLTIAIRLDASLVTRGMTNNAIEGQIDCAAHVEFVAAAQRAWLLGYFYGDAEHRWSVILDSTWGMTVSHRDALFGFVASVHLACPSVVEAAVTLQHNAVWACWSVANGWPSSYGRLLKPLGQGGHDVTPEGDLWEMVHFRTRSMRDGEAPTLHTLSIAQTRRLAGDVRGLARGIKMARKWCEGLSFDEGVLDHLRAYSTVDALKQDPRFRTFLDSDEEVLAGLLVAANQNGASALALYAMSCRYPQVEGMLGGLKSEGQ